MKKPLLILILLFSTTLFAQKTEFNTKIEGNIRFAKDSSVIELSEPYLERYSETTYVVNGHFSFSLNLSSPIYVSVSGPLKTKYNGRYLLIEPGITKVVAENYNDLDKMKVIEGSALTLENERYIVERKRKILCRYSIY